jgi:GT2 family glycosyltransferase
MKKVGVVVVTYNRLTLLKEVIESLRNQTFTDMQIVIVNNGSDDGTKEWIETQTDIIMITQKNLGCAGGFFTGIKYAIENGCNYCWLMDDDVICYPTALEELMNAFQQIDSNVGFLCSKVIGIDGYSPMNVPQVDTRPTKNGYPNWYDKIENQMIKVRTATFVSLFIPAIRIKELGLPYKEFFIWGDDTEYTERISNKYDSYIATKSIVIHKREQQMPLSFYAETNQVRLKLFFYRIRNSSYIYNKHATFFQKSKRTCSFIPIFFKLLLKLDFKRASIIFKSRISLLTFSPKIQYPNLE